LLVYTEARPGLLKASCVALGFFDSVHPGHQAVIKKAVDEARRLDIASGVVTFYDHPRGLTRGQAPQLLTVIEQRLDLFEALGVDHAMVLTFSEELCRLSPREYVENVLLGSMGAKSISVGHNHHFGRNREGDANLLRQYGQEDDFVVHVADMVFVDGLEVSSSRIRQLIEQKDMPLAASLLSRPYAVRGTIVGGAQRGRKIGFPTANVSAAFNQLIPPPGVYAGYIRQAKDGPSLLQPMPCVINIGYRPTFSEEVKENKENPLTVEAHVLDFEGDLYDQTLEVQFVQYLRGEIKFEGIKQLVDQIASDCQSARCYLAACT